MKHTDLLVKALSTPIVLVCRECSEEFCAVQSSPAHVEQLCMTCAAIKYLAENHAPRHFGAGVWITMERKKLAGVMARFAQTILTEKYLPYIPKFGVEDPSA